MLAERVRGAQPAVPGDLIHGQAGGFEELPGAVELGRAWHAPVIVRTVREVATRLAELHQAPPPRLAEMTDRERTLLGFTDPIWDEFWETDYLSHRPFVVDASRIEATFGLTASPLDDVL